MAKKKQATSAASSVAEGMCSAHGRPPLPQLAPWLVIPYGKRMKNQAFYNLCEPDNKTCQKLIPELSGKSFYQKPCHQGWLVILCDQIKVDYTPNWTFGDCFMWNPATLETIQLPSIPSSGHTYDKYILVDCVLTGPPKTGTTSSSSGDETESLVFILLERRDNECDYIFLFCRPGERQWRKHKYTRAVHCLGPNDISSLHYLKGSLYGLSSSNVSHFKIEVEQIDGDNFSLCVSPIETCNDTGYLPCIGGIYTSCTITKYVQSCDELYRLVFRYTIRGDEVQGQEVISLNVARLNFSLMQWKEVSSFGDHVLFSGKSTTACCSAAELGFNRGCLYYTLPEDQSLYKFELEGTGTVTLPCLKLPTPCFSSDWIMMPTTFRVGEQERSELMLNRREERDFITSIGVRLNNKCENQGEVNQQGPWSILQDDTLLKTASYLHPIDYKQFRLVCKAIRSNLPIFKQTPTSGTILSNRYVSPWLVFSVNNECTVYNFVDPMHNNENYFMERPLLKGAIIRFQKDGWLLMSEGAHRLFFHNPFTKETINIPDLPQHYHFSNISFFSLPTCSDCVVYGIQVDEEDEGIRVYIIARGEKSWRDHMFDNIDTDGYYMPSLNTPVLYKGILYSVDYNGLVGTLSSEDNINWSYQVVNKPRGIFDGAYPSFLVECGGDLLLVKLGRMGVFKGIFRLNFSKKEWVRVKSLGKHMLFISYTSCVSRIALRADMENKIYFSRLSLHGEGILLYSLDTGNYHSLGNQRSSKDFYDTKGWASWSWIEPNWSRSTSEELDWFANLS